MGEHKDPIFNVPDPEEPAGNEANQQAGPIDQSYASGQGQPMQGQPMQGQPMQGQPMQGQPMQRQPMQGQMMQGQVPGQPGVPQEPPEPQFIPDVKLGAPGIIGLLVGIVVAIIMAITIDKYTAIPAAILSTIISTSLLTLFRKLRMNRLIVNGILLGVAVFAFVVVTFIAYPLWLGNFTSFREKIESLSDKFESTVAEQQEKHYDNLPTVITKLDVSARDSVTKGLENVGAILSVEQSTQAKILFQMCLFAAAVIFLPVLIIATTPGLGDAVPPEQRRGFMAWFGPGLFRCIHGIGELSLVRVFKAILISVVCFFGLGAAGLDALFFISGIVFCFALVCNLSPAIAFILGIVMVPFSTSGWMQAIAMLVLTVCAMMLIEKKFHWLLFFLPPAKRRMFMPNQGSGKAGAAIGWIMRLLPHAVSIAIFACVGFGVWQVYKVFMNNTAREKAIYATDKLRSAGKYEEAAAKYNQIINDSRVKGNPMFVVPGSHPGDIQVYYSMLRCRVKQGDFDKAIKLANHMATFAPEPPSGLVNKFRYKILEIIVKSESDRHSPEKGLEMIVKDKNFRKSTNSQRFKDLANSIFEQKPDDFWGHVCNARAAYIDEDYEAALQHAAKGIEKYPDNEAILQIQAESYAKLGRWDDCKAACEKVLDVDGDNEDVKALHKMCLDPSLRPPPPETTPEDGAEGGGDNKEEVKIEPEK